jgi:hypothetical protein
MFRFVGEQDAVAVCAERQEHLLRIADEVRGRPVAVGEQDLVQVVEEPARGAVAHQQLVHRLQQMPGAVLRRRQRLHHGPEPLARDARVGVELELSLLLPGRAEGVVHAPALKRVAVRRDDEGGSFLPLGIPIPALGAERVELLKVELREIGHRLPEQFAARRPAPGTPQRVRLVAASRHFGRRTGKQ